MFFEKWQEHRECEISRHLLWEYDLSTFDWDAMKVKVVARVIERGHEKDFYSLFNLYGGYDAVRELVKQIPSLSPIDAAFAEKVFQIKKNEMQCYKRQQLRRKHLGY